MPDLQSSLQLQVSSLLLDEDGQLTQRIQAGRTLRAAILLDLVALARFATIPTASTSFRQPMCCLWPPACCMT
jgi:hypothetical protein